MLYLAVVLFYSAFFSHPDIWHTVISSYAYLIGHFGDFYEYNRNVVNGNDYLPLVYVIFAIWNLPFYVLSGGTFADYQNYHKLGLYELALNKALIGALFFVSIWIIGRVVNILERKEGLANRVRIFYASSTVMLFCIFFTNQYDIIGIVLTLMGLFFYSRGKLIPFVLFFSAAVSLKYFAIIAFFPLLLAKEKKLWRILGYGALVLLVPLFQIIIYSDSSLFMESVFALAQSKLFGKNDAAFRLGTLLIPTAYILMLIACYFSSGDQKDAPFRYGICGAIFGYWLVYLHVDWHPQWISIVVPYVALATLFIKYRSITYLVWTFFGAAYLLLVIYFYPNSLDSNLLDAGFFSQYFGGNHISILNFYKNIDFLYVKIVFYTAIAYFFLGPLLSTLVHKWRTSYFLSVVSLLPNLIYIVPVLIIGFAPISYLKKIDPIAEYRNRCVRLHTPGTAIGTYIENIRLGRPFVEMFYPVDDSLNSISFVFGAYDKPLTNKVEFSLRSKDKVIYSKVVDLKHVAAGNVYTLNEINSGDECRNGCSLRLNVVEGADPIKLWTQNSKTNSIEYDGRHLQNSTIVIADYYLKVGCR